VLLGALALMLTAEIAAASSVNVRLRLPVRARLDLIDVESIAVAPFLVVTNEEDQAIERRGFNIQKEFEGYLLRILRRSTPLKVIEPGPVDYPSYDLETLSGNEDFWRFLGERTGSDLILSGSLDFDIQDRSGYRTEEYVSPFDGRTYYRQVLVEQTGFEYDIVMEVFDGRTGKRLYTENFKDFRRFDGESVDPLSGMFENLLALEDRVSGVFSQQQVEATRTLFTN
jgi:hypothetical protein